MITGAEIGSVCEKLLELGVKIPTNPHDPDIEERFCGLFSEASVELTDQGIKFCGVDAQVELYVLKHRIHYAVSYHNPEKHLWCLNWASVPNQSEARAFYREVEEKLLN